MNFLIELLVSALMLLGSGFVLVGAVGLARFPDFYTRLHGPTKATTLGVGGVLVASVLYFSFSEHGVSLHELLITLFLFMTAPISAHLLVKAARHLRLAHVSGTRLPPDE